MTQAKGDAKAEATALAYIPCVPVNNSTLTTIGSDSSNLVKAPAIKPVQLQPPVAKPKQ